ncbi:MAG: YeeE/YedE family protein, partial [Proteobacteria bacterium]|nr:YeeE/YedE family protein [Pseudomonadota bacterium]
MIDLNWSMIGGLVSGALAGAGARYGRVCSMSAIEDALVARDFRGAKAWGLAVGVAGLATTGLVALGLVDLSTATAIQPRLHVLGALLGGVLFGLGMTLVGTCSFGLVVRAGGGDLRAFVAMLLVGIVAFAVTAGVLSPLRELLLDVGAVDVGAFGRSSFDAVIAGYAPAPLPVLLPMALFATLVGVALFDKRMRRRPRLVTGAVILGCAVAIGWLATTAAVADLKAARVTSLSFVAPAGRALLQLMTTMLRDQVFGTSALIGAIA